MGNVTCVVAFPSVFFSTLGLVGSKYRLSARVIFPPGEAKREWRTPRLGCSSYLLGVDNAVLVPFRVSSFKMSSVVAFVVTLRVEIR